MYSQRKSTKRQILTSGNLNRKHLESCRRIVLWWRYNIYVSKCITEFLINWKSFFFEAQNSWNMNIKRKMSYYIYNLSTKGNSYLDMYMIFSLSLSLPPSSPSLFRSLPLFLSLSRDVNKFLFESKKLFCICE